MLYPVNPGMADIITRDKIEQMNAVARHEQLLHLAAVRNSDETKQAEDNVVEFRLVNLVIRISRVNA